MVVLATAFDRSRTIYRVEQDGVSERRLCTASQALGPGLPASAQRSFQRQQLSASGVHPSVRMFTLSRNAEETSEPGRPIIVRYSLSNAGATTGGRDAVVYFHGGPGATMAWDFFPRAVRRSLRPGRDVIAVEYSGSLGGGPELLRGSRQRGMEAVNEDIDTLARWLQGQSYENVSVVGESFGGVPALSAVVRHRQLFSQAFFIAPVLDMDDSRDRIGTGINPRPTLIEYQDASEFAHFGGREGRARFSASLHAMLTSGRLSPRDRFYFGEVDRASRPSQLPVEVSSVRYVSPRASHQGVLSDDVVWDDIVAHLDDAARAAN